MQLLLPRGDYEVGEEGEVKMGESGDLIWLSHFGAVSQGTCPVTHPSVVRL